MTTQKLRIHWWSHHDGSYTCHRNDPGLSAAASLLAAVAPVDGKWSVVFSDGTESEVSFETAQAAKEYTMQHLTGSEIAPWDP